MYIMEQKLTVGYCAWLFCVLKTGLPTIFIIRYIHLERSNEETVPFPLLSLLRSIFLAITRMQKRRPYLTSRWDYQPRSPAMTADVIALRIAVQFAVPAKLWPVVDLVFCTVASFHAVALAFFTHTAVRIFIIRFGVRFR